jgi:hypothetical protein
VYIECEVGTVAIVRSVGIDLAAVDELFGDGLINTQVDQDHQFDGVFNVVVLHQIGSTSSEMMKFLIIRCRVCLRMSVVRTTSF